jgi:FkbM family methyltransferase
MLLSIVIPAYDRAEPLRYALNRFIDQAGAAAPGELEIIVVDDASPNNALAFVEDLARAHPFISYQRHPQNIGLEKNLIACTQFAKGEYLWIFGDDDFLEPDDALATILIRLRKGDHDFFVLNRTRRSFDLSTQISPNWMGLDAPDQSFKGLREFCRQFGLISVIGFISVNIFRREDFTAIDPDAYFGTMYPQLGAMVEAFHDKPVELIAEPLVCHRTQTAEEKRAALGGKKSEADFMADAERRNALYFSHPYVRMIAKLVERGALSVEDVTMICENTVINGLLVDFLIHCIELSTSYPERFDRDDWSCTLNFFASLPLSKARRARIAATAESAGMKDVSDLADARACQARPNLTVSVISPSFNQAEFLDECLQSVLNQTVKPIEHLVFDPGSSDGSRDIAARYAHVTLRAEPDDGQSDAINKGFKLASGDIIAWLNSDDIFYNEEVFQKVIERFEAPDRPDIVYGRGIFTDQDDKFLRDVYINKQPDSLPWRLQQEDGILQPALFMRRSVVETVGPLTGHLHFCMDYEYWIRCMKAGLKFAYVDENFATARYHLNNKTYGQRGASYAEVCSMLMTQFGYVNHNWLLRYAEHLVEGHDGVLASSHTKGAEHPEKIEAEYNRLLTVYNRPAWIYHSLEKASSERGRGDTFRVLKERGLGPTVPCEEVALDSEPLPGKVQYTVGPRRWAFDASWKKAELAKAHHFLRGQIATRKNDVCVIVGNGPSLKKSDLSLLRNADVIISNNAFLDEELVQYADYYTVVNYLVAEQSAYHINEIKDLNKVLPYWTGYCLNPGDDTYFVEAVGHAAFSKDMFKNMSWRHTVTFYNMHLAFGLGYKRVALIGFDHSYKQKAGVKEGEIIQSDTPDENHFDSRYFRGKKWQAADVDMMEAMYRLAKAAYEEEGRELVNATEGGALELLPRMRLSDAVAMRPLDQQKPASPARLEYERADGAGVDETEVVAHLLRERKGGRNVMLDVGAHIGTSAAFFLDLDWTVHCFEPDPNNRKSLVESYDHLPNAIIDPRAVSTEPAKGLEFFTSPESTGISGLHAFRDTHESRFLVDATSVKDVVESRDIKRINFLKIDVEGFDLAVLKGVPWDQIKPEVVEAEFEDAKTLRLGHSYNDLCDYLAQRGYTVYLSEWHPIVRYGVAHDWRRVIKYPEPLRTSEAWGNVLAFLEDPGLERVQEAFQAKLTFRNRMQ